MNYLIRLTIIFNCILSLAFAQNAKSVFFEKAPNNMVRFFYDYDYFLVDKNCEFKLIERVAEFDIPSNKFNGDFKDFDSNGRAILSGSYKDGLKEGTFSAYYPNGTLKWETTFANDLPHGMIKYYYPDGKPMLHLTNFKGSTIINDYWNREGQQVVKEGQGRIDVTLPIQGFTDHGFTKYNVSGQVTNGYPQGLWYTSFITEDKKPKTIHLMTTAYENGVKKAQEVEEMFQYMLIDFDSFKYAPYESFSNAELLQSKNCSFDEHTGFNSFLSQKFKKFLTRAKYNTDIDNSTSITYTVRVSKAGVPFSPNITETSRELNDREEITLKRMINSIQYYLPSYLNNEAITDKLTVSFQIQTKGDNIYIFPAQINREKGF